MGTHRAHIVFPTDLVAQIDAIAGDRGRNAFVVETMRAAVRRHKLQQLMEKLQKEPVWRDEDHPEIVKLGTAEYVRQMRRTQSERQKGLDQKLAEI